MDVPGRRIQKASERNLAANSKIPDGSIGGMGCASELRFLLGKEKFGGPLRVGLRIITKRPIISSVKRKLFQSCLRATRLPSLTSLIPRIRFRRSAGLN